MKLTTLFLFIALFQISAKGYSQITLKEKNASLDQIFNKITRQTGYSFVYKESDIPLKSITVDVHDVSLKEALDLCFKDAPVDFEILKKVVLIKPRQQSLMDKLKDLLAAPIRLNGKVTDTTGTPLAGATVLVVGKGGTRYITTRDGFFYIEANENDVVSISYIGYQTYTITVKKNLPFQNVVLHTASNQLNEVTVQTGYQTLSKERATGSFAKPDMKVFADRSSSLDVVARLDGQIPGLTILQGTDNGGEPSVKGTITNRALIRGASSVQLSTEPLYVVNGVIEDDFSSINVDDIQDITVLKDAAAAAIWGARAANGVIVITTKSGGRNQKIKVNYSGFINFKGKPDLAYQRVLSSSQYIQAAKETFDPVAYPWASLYDAYIAPHETILYNQYQGLISAAQANSSLDSLSKINNLDQIKNTLYRNAFTTNHTVSASGGGNKYSFYSSLGYADLQNSTPGNKNSTYRFNLNQDFTLSDRIKISLNTSLSDQVTGSMRAISPTAAFLPYQLFKDSGGNNISMPYVQGMSPDEMNSYQSLSRVNLNYNPLDEYNDGHTNSNNLTANITANATVKLWKGLSFLGTYGYLTSPGTTSSYDDFSEYKLRRELVDFTVAPTVNSTPVYYLPNYGGTYVASNYNQRNWTVRNQLVYNFSSRDGKDLITLQGGQDASEQLATSNSNTLRGYDEALQTYALIDYNALNNGIPNTITYNGYLNEPAYQSSELRSRFNSYFGLASYTLNQKYSFDASWRVDHSNLFGSDVSSQNKPVWSAGGKWNITREDFMKQVSWLNELSLRATYGITGNSPYVGGASTYDILSVEQAYSYPLIAGKSYVVSQPANDRLTWETTHTTNIGADFVLLKNRLSGSFDYYHKNTTSLLGTGPLDPFTGYNSTLSNLGELTNSGIEVSLRSVNIQGIDFSWSTGLVFSHNSNKLVSYTPPQSYSLTADGVVNGDATYYAGYSLNALFAYRYAGLDKVGDPQIRLANGTVTKKPGVAMLSDLVDMGTTIPKINGGFSNNFRYKQFGLAFNMIYSFGAVMRRDVNQFYSGRLTGNKGSFTIGNVSADFADRWKKPGDEAFTNIPAYTSDEDYDEESRNTQYYTDADINVVSASYVKLRDATFSYHLSPNVLRYLKIQDLTLRAQLGNVMLWKANKYGIDPEYQSYTRGVRAIPDNEHNITLGVNVSF